jgi:hypothetical protein
MSMKDRTKGELAKSLFELPEQEYLGTITSFSQEELCGGVGGHGKNKESKWRAVGRDRGECFRLPVKYGM